METVQQDAGQQIKDWSACPVVEGQVEAGQSESATDTRAISEQEQTVKSLFNNAADAGSRTFSLYLI